MGKRQEILRAPDIATVKKLKTEFDGYTEASEKTKRSVKRAVERRTQELQQ